ncbi:MAG: FAD-binding oxidoreductase [Solirubrobacteraceae bacterium]|nr:FAD-binding oxidoreductase [Patulibacter sp.]
MTISADLTSAPSSDPAEALVALRDRLAGELAFPGQPGYELATPWNVAVVQKPIAVIVAASTDDVAETIRVCNEHGLRAAVRRTGHGAVTIDADDTVLIHTARLDAVEIDSATRTARVGGGAIWQQVLDAATPHGLAPLVGSSPNVGVSGFLTGAGIGPLVRTYGLSSDHVREFRVVTGDGQVLRAAPDENPDVFWGLRGGKGSLGIVTEVVIDLLPIATLIGGSVSFDGADAPAVLAAWRELCQDLPEHVNTSIAFMQLPPLPQIPAPLAGKLTLSVRFASVGSEDEARALLAPLLAVATPILGGVGEMPYAAIASIHADPVDPMPTREHSTLLRDLTPEGIDTLLELCGPGSGSPQTIVELRLLGGALAREPEHASAFTHRGAAFTLFAVGVLAPPVAEMVHGHGAQLMAAMAPHETGGTLPNFTATDDPARLARCYDDNARHWLGALADQHDPAGVLRVGQVIRGDLVA